MKKSLDEIKKLWEEETDEWLVRAATENLKEYKPEIQEIIINEVKKRGLEGVNPNSLKPATAKTIAEYAEEKAEEAKEFFKPERSLIKLGILGGLIMMIGAVIWFILGYIFGWIFYYPTILFLIGLFAFLKGMVTGNIAGEKMEAEEEDSVSENSNREDVIFNRKYKN